MNKFIFLSLILFFACSSANAEYIRQDRFGNYQMSNGVYIQNLGGGSYTTSNGDYIHKMNDYQWRTNSGTVNVRKDTWGNYNVTSPNGSYYLQRGL